MLIKSLSDNISLNEKFLHEHGLSIYIEINNIKVLFDTGASSIFSNNALKLNIKLKDVDYLIISHGHYDHGGGLNTFLNINTKAKIFFQKNAFNDFYSSQENNTTKYIGLDKSLINNDRLILIDNEFKINEYLMLFSKV